MLVFFYRVCARFLIILQTHYMSTQTDIADKAQTNTAEKGDPSLIDRLFSAGAHFGFSRSRRHPTAIPFLFGAKQGTDIFDLEKTAELLEDASAYMRELGTNKKTVLFVGTKEEVSMYVRATADALNAPYVVNRWIGGMLTNFSEIKKRIDRLDLLRKQVETGELERKYTKKERLMVSREVEKLNHNFGGIADIERLPAALVVVDPRYESIAVKEAEDMNIPVIAIMGSDCDASKIKKPIFVNDAHTKSVELVLNELKEAYQAGVATAPTETKGTGAPKKEESRTV